MTIHERAIASYPAPTRVQIRRDGTTTAAHSLAPGAMAVSYGDKRLNVGVDVAVDPSGIISFPGVAELASQLANYETSAHASATYLTQANAASTYETSVHAAATYETQAHATATYETQAHATATYLPLTTAAATYLTQANAASTYLTQANAASTYLTPAQGDARYLTPGQAAGLYLPIAGGTLTGNLGIYSGVASAAPRSILDVVGNANADGGVTAVIQNKSNGANASAYFSLQNDLGHGVTIGAYSSTHPDVGSGPYGPDGCVIVTPCAKGMAVGTQNAAPLIFQTNGTFQAVISPTGGLTMDQFANPGVDGSQITIKNRATTGYSQFVLYNDVTLFQITYTGSGYGGTAPVKPDMAMLASRGANGILINTYVAAPIILAIGSEVAAAFNTASPHYLALGPLVGAPNNARFMVDALESKNGMACFYIGNASTGNAAQCGVQVYTPNSTAALNITGPNFTAAGAPYAPDQAYLTSGNCAAGLMLITTHFPAPIQFAVNSQVQAIMGMASATGVAWHAFGQGITGQIGSAFLGINYDTRQTGGLGLSDRYGGGLWYIGPGVGTGAAQINLNFYNNNKGAMQLSMDPNWGALILPSLIFYSAASPNMFWRSPDGYVGYQSSSLKHKADLEDIPVETARDIIAKLKPFTYRSLGPMDDDKRFIGLGAEDLHEIEPLLVTYGKDDEPLSVMYDRLPVIEAIVIQDLMKRVDKLEKRARH